MAEATRLFRFREGNREFVSVGVPGQVSVLSGMLPGAYSVTINWAPPAGTPTFDHGPAFLVRHMLETCSSYRAALEVLRDTPLSTSVFFTLCGIDEDQACVIERTQRAAVVREPAGPALAQANHHVGARFSRNNKVLSEVEDAAFHDDSSRRADALCQSLLKAGPALTLDDAVAALNAPPVFNQYTVQQMIFCPRTGDLRVWHGANATPGEG
jgi:hypothetical protein